jgi:hypothetical protein
MRLTDRIDFGIRSEISCVRKAVVSLLVKISVDSVFKRSYVPNKQFEHFVGMNHSPPAPFPRPKNGRQQIVVAVRTYNKSDDSADSHPALGFAIRSRPHVCACGFGLNPSERV